MWELDHKEGRALKNWCFRTVVLEKSLGSPLDNKEIKPVNPKGNQSWILLGRTNVEAEAPILWSPDVKSQVIEKTLMLGKIEDRRRRRWQRMRWLDSITDSIDMNLGKLWEVGRNREAWRTVAHGIANSWIQLGDWTTITSLVLPAQGPLFTNRVQSFFLARETTEQRDMEAVYFPFYLLAFLRTIQGVNLNLVQFPHVWAVLFGLVQVSFIFIGFEETNFLLGKLCGCTQPRG